MHYRVLVVEDEPLVGLDVASILANAGYTIEGPFRTVCGALHSLGQVRPAVAVLDFRVGEDTALSVADLLNRNGVPYIWLTGYPAEAIPDRHRDHKHPVVSKPFTSKDLVGILDRAVGR
jgi:DNA-binding NtrC family response regulator